MATVQNVINQAGYELGILRLGQVLQAQDQARLQTAYDQVYAQLRRDGLATWSSDGLIPDEVVPYVSALIADNCLNTYGVSNDRYKRIKNSSGSVALSGMKSYTAPSYVAPDTPTNY